MKTLTVAEPESNFAAVNDSSALSRQPNPLATPTESAIEEFLTALTSGIDCWIRAGQLLVKMREADPAIFKKIIQRNRSLTAEVLWSFHRIGLGKLYPQLLLLRKCPAESALVMCDYSTQERLCKEPIEVVIKLKKDGTPVIEKRWVQEIGKETTHLLFKEDGLRSVAAQAEMLKAEIKRSGSNKTYNLPPVRSDAKPAINTFNFGKKLTSLGCWKVSWRNGEPLFSKLPGPVPISACSALLLEDDDGTLGGVIEFRRW